MTYTFIKHTLVCIAVFVLKTAYAQKTITVNNTPGTVADYTTIQEAVNAASNGDYIYIQPSETAYADATINKTLHIRGRSHSLKNYITKVGMLDFNYGCDGSSVEGLYGTVNLNTEGNEVIRNIEIKHNFLFNSGLGCNVENLKVQGNVIDYLGRFSGLMGYDNVSRKNVLFSNNLCLSGLDFKSLSDEGITIRNNIFNTNKSIYKTNFEALENKKLTISKCIFIADTDENEILVKPSEDKVGDLIFRDCVLYNFNTSGTYQIIENNDSPIDYVNTINCKYNINPQFVNYSGGFQPDIDDYHLKPNAPIKGAGVFGE